MTSKEIRKILKTHLRAMTKERNDLEDLMNEVMEQSDRYDSVIESIEEAIERLSEVV